jgi:hypothetical protein
MGDTKWYRAIDNQGRLFALALTGNLVSVYYPDIEGEHFVVADKAGHVHTSSFGGRPVKYRRDDIEATRLEEFKRSNLIVGQVETTMPPGRYFPRVYRGPEHPPVDVAARTATMRAARNLFSMLRGIFQVVEPAHAHDSVFGHELRQLLILACTEVESSWRAILSANGYAQGAGRWTTNDYVKLLGPMKLDSYVVTLASHPGYGEIWPFEGWEGSDPTRSLAWYNAYNLTKHNREEELHRATLQAAIAAMAAVHVLTAAQFGFDEVERGHFHADEFNFERSPRWFGDAYIRPLLLPDRPLVENDRYAEWPREWVKGDCPF